MSLEHVREIADAVLYEGYLLYPYRASSSKNQSRWQFGVLGPPLASSTSYAEDSGMEIQVLLRPRSPTAQVTIHLRFLHLQVREAQALAPDGDHRPVSSLTVDGREVLSWDEAVEQEIIVGTIDLSPGVAEFPIIVSGGEDVEPVLDVGGTPVGRIIRRRRPLTATARVSIDSDPARCRLSVQVTNRCPDPVDGKDEAIRSSLIGAHLLLEAAGAEFISLLEPAPEDAAAVARCRQRRCHPVLVGVPGSTDVLLGSPIILYDYPEIAAQSQGALFDSTEIDEILTLRVMTMTDAEKAEARATDPRARDLIDRCDSMSPTDLQQLHGILRNPHAVPSDVSGGFTDLRDLEPPSFETGSVPWWDPEADAAVQPGTDAVVINGIRVARGSIVRVHPSRRADAQDLFFADQVARVTAVLSDVDGNVHVALVLVDDPAADLHEEAGRYFYFGPDELEPMTASAANRQESRS